MTDVEQVPLAHTGSVGDGAPSRGPRSPVLGDVPADAPWAILDQTDERWRQGMCQGVECTRQPARYIYLRMGSPRSIKRLRRGMTWLGFKGVSGHELHDWCRQGRWPEHAIAYDLGERSVDDLKKRISKVRHATLLPLVDQLAEALGYALDADTIRHATLKAAKKGDLTGLVDAAEKIANMMAGLAGEVLLSQPAPQVHQHVHAHLGEGEAPPAAAPDAGPYERVLTAYGRTLSRLDEAAAEKRARGVKAPAPAGSNGHKANGKANGKTINGNGEDHDDEHE